MPQSFSAVNVHLVFSTKHRDPLFRDLDKGRNSTHILEGFQKHSIALHIIVGGVEDHIHFLGRMGRTISLADWVKELKRVSNSWLKEQGPEFAKFEWQRGYGAFSVSQSALASVENYIATQEEHHRTMSFQDEFRAMLQKHELEWDERYVWD